MQPIIILLDHERSTLLGNRAYQYQTGGLDLVLLAAQHCRTKYSQWVYVTPPLPWEPPLGNN
jgi:hypothetical protein